MNEPGPHTVLVGLIDPKTPTNVGAIMRAAGCYQANGVRYTGERFGYASKYHTDTNNVTGKVPLVHAADILLGLPDAMKVICVELAEGATPLPEFEHPSQALYIFGPEDGSIPQKIIDAAHSVVYIPTIGCMNLAATVNVVLYDRLSKSLPAFDNEQLIKESRDINNRLKVPTATSSQ